MNSYESILKYYGYHSPQTSHPSGTTIWKSKDFLSKADDPERKGRGHLVSYSKGKKGGWTHSQHGGDATHGTSHVDLAAHLGRVHSSQHAEQFAEGRLVGRVTGARHNTFLNILAQHGGRHRGGKGFSVPDRHVQRFHKAASAAGFDYGTHYVGMNAGHSATQHGEHEYKSGYDSALHSMGVRREANRDGLHRYAGRGHVVELDPRDKIWTHYYKGQVHKEGKGIDELHKHARHMRAYFGRSATQHGESKVLEGLKNTNALAAHGYELRKSHPHDTHHTYVNPKTKHTVYVDEEGWSHHAGLPSMKHTTGDAIIARSHSGGRGHVTLLGHLASFHAKSSQHAEEEEHEVEFPNGSREKLRVKNIKKSRFTRHTHVGDIHDAEGNHLTTGHRLAGKWLADSDIESQHAEQSHDSFHHALSDNGFVHHSYNKALGVHTWKHQESGHVVMHNPKSGRWWFNASSQKHSDDTHTGKGHQSLADHLSSVQYEEDERQLSPVGFVAPVPSSINSAMLGAGGSRRKAKATQFSEEETHADVLKKHDYVLNSKSSKREYDVYNRDHHEVSINRHGQSLWWRYHNRKHGDLMTGNSSKELAEHLSDIHKS